MNVITRDSDIHGTGVFARELIEKDHWQYIYGRTQRYIPGDITERYSFDSNDPNEIFVPYAPFCFLNHSSEPNCEVVEDEETGCTLIVTLRDIDQGEELTIDYDKEFDTDDTDAIVE